MAAKKRGKKRPLSIKHILSLIIKNKKMDFYLIEEALKKIKTQHLNNMDEAATANAEMQAAFERVVDERNKLANELKLVNRKYEDLKSEKNVTQTQLYFLFQRRETEQILRNPLDAGCYNFESDTVTINISLSLTVRKGETGSDISFNFYDKTLPTQFFEIIENSHAYKCGLIRNLRKWHGSTIRFDLDHSVTFSSSTKLLLVDEEDLVEPFSLKSKSLDDLIAERDSSLVKNEALFAAAKSGKYKADEFTEPIEGVTQGTPCKWKRPSGCVWEKEYQDMIEARCAEVYLPMARKFRNETNKLVILFEGNEPLAQRLKEVSWEDVIF